jgi:hypothetical protein
VVQKIDHQRKTESPRKREQWERQKWLLVRYVVNDPATLKGVSKYAGVTNEGARLIYYQTLNTLWENSSQDLQKTFPKSEIMRAKKQAQRRGLEISSETREKMGAAQRASEASRRHLTELHMGRLGKKHSAETKEKISKAVIDQLRGGTIW